MSGIREFSISERVVYPSHGVGQIINIESQIIADTTIKVYVVLFEKSKLTLKVPVSRAVTSGLRTLTGKDDMVKIYSVLRSKPKQGNRMWSRRAQEYGSKINSGNILAVTEVVRDLYRNVDSDRSYSERTIYELALNRLAGELAVLEEITHAEAIDKLVELLKEKAAA